MHFSRTFKSSSQSLPSPDGNLIATILPSKLSIRATRNLETSRVVSLPPELTASVHWFLWSRSSDRVLLASTDNIRVFSASNPKFTANITHPTSGTTKVASICFGATDDELCVFSEFGLKLSIFNLANSTSVDIHSPKFYNPGVTGKGISYRPGTSNLALLTRTGGKDIVSIHTRDTLGVKRSWHPGTTDANGISWSPDGRWLAVWESAAQGHNLLVYTADGHLYKTWNGPIPISEDEADLTLGAGIKSFEWNRTGTYVAIGDHSQRITILSVPSFNEVTSLLHVTVLKPTDTLQIWQELTTTSQTGGIVRRFVEPTQSVCPPRPGTPSNSVDTKPGTSFMSFDNSGTLLATRTENMPTAIWIWDINTRILRAVMIFHTPIAKTTWHPTVDEILLIRCEGETSRGLVHAWDPSWDSPKMIDFASHLPGGNVIGKTVGRWLNTKSGHPAIFFSDSQDGMLASMATDREEQPWCDAVTFDSHDHQEESPLSLVAAEKRPYGRDDMLMDDSTARTSGGSSDGEVDDTFRFRR